MVLQDKKKITAQTNAVIESYGMQSDGNASSWVPINEYFDTLDINEHVLIDIRMMVGLSGSKMRLEKQKKLLKTRLVNLLMM